MTKKELEAKLALMTQRARIAEAEVESLKNKLNADSQNFELECRKAEIEQLKAKLAEIRGELHNFELNGSDEAAQIRGVYADLQEATNKMRAYKARLKKLGELDDQG